MRKGIMLAAVAATCAVVSLALVPNVVRACGVGTQFNLSAGSGPPGSQVTATGDGFASGPVSLRWANPSGQTLATTSGPLFSRVPLVIPASASPGVYNVDAWDGVGSMYVTAAFTVTSPPSAPPPPAASSPPVSNTVPAPTGPVNPTNAGTGPAPSTVPGGVASSDSSTAVSNGVAPGALHSTMPGLAAGDPLGSSTGGDTAQVGTGGTASSPATAATSHAESVSSLFEAPSAGFMRPGHGALPTASATDVTQNLGAWPALLAAGVTASLLGGLALAVRRRRVRGS